jgi:hypothetical protein
VPAFHNSCSDAQHQAEPRLPPHTASALI